MPTIGYDFSTAVDRSAMSSAKWRAMYDANPDVPAGVIPLSVADIDMYNAPEILHGLKDYLDDVVLGYTLVPDSFVASVIAWMWRRHHWRVEPEWLVQSNGVIPAICAAIRSFTDPGDGVIVQTPAYRPFYQSVTRNSRRFVANPLILDHHRFRLDFDRLESLATDPRNKVLLFCSPHNPTGRVWSREELECVVDIAARHDLLIISDEIHFDIIMPGVTHTLMADAAGGVTDRVIICTSPSKTFNLAGMETSNIIIPERGVRERFIAEQQAVGFRHLTVLGYKACELAYNSCESWLDKLIRLVWLNHRLVRHVLQEQLPQIEVFPLEGTYLQWMDFRALGRSAEEMKTIHELRAMLFFDEGTMFGESGAGFERMNLATPSVVIGEALDRLVQVYS